MRVIVVDDASPEAGMVDYLATLPVDLLTCPRNLGFVGAVNAALAHVESGDIVLLNADTVLPAGAIGRLRATAASASDIGTVTPLSNNGELTSMPIPFQENPLPDTSQIARIDAAAAALDGDPIELPTGIGFCLYITRACLDAVGGLSVHYERGYGEDVHLCLAGREAGFRSVCATSVFVGHAGTRSFGAEKRRLVMRNAARVDARFPTHEHELAAFVTADPLHDIRHAIGGKLIETFEGAILVADNGSIPQAEAHLAELARTGQPALMATCDRGKVIWLTYDGAGALQAETAYALPEDNRPLASRRGKLTAVNVTVFSPEAFFAMGFDKIKCPFDLHICNAGAIANRTGITAAPATSKAWRFSIAAARRIVAPDARAEAFVLSHWPQAGDKMTVPTPTTERHAKAPDANPRRLGVVLLAETAACRRLIGRLGASVPRGADDEPGLLVIGNTADDLRLIRAGGIMMTGKAAPDEIATLARRHRLTHMLALSSTAQFGSPVAKAAAALDLPLAQFDWTGAASTATADLWLDPKADDDVVVATLATWLNEDASAS